MSIGSILRSKVTVITSLTGLQHQAATHPSQTGRALLAALLKEAEVHDAKLQERWNNPEQQKYLRKRNAIGPEAFTGQSVKKELYASGACLDSAKWTLQTLRTQANQPSALGMLRFDGYFRPESSQRLSDITLHYVAMASATGDETTCIASDFTYPQFALQGNTDFLIVLGEEVDVTSYVIHHYFSLAHHLSTPDRGDDHHVLHRDEITGKVTRLASYWSSGYVPGFVEWRA
ncbi:MAG: hypothetical protein ABH823_05490 [bacterium]